jgi:hypothetical protein
MKKTLCALALGAFAAAGLGIATASAINSFEVRADDPTPVEHADLYSNECVYRGGEGATWNPSTNEVTVPSAGTGFEYDAPTNASIKATYTHHGYADSHWAGWLNIAMRATDSDVTPTNGFTNSGYSLAWRGDGTTLFYKNGVQKDVVAAGAGVYQWGGSYQTEFSTINLSDGSVHVKFKVGETVVVDWIDNDSPILEGTVYASWTDQHNYSVLGCDIIPETVKNLSAPIAHNAASIVYEEISCAGGASGVSYGYEAGGSQGWTAPFRVNEAAGGTVFSIGAKEAVISKETPCYFVEMDQWSNLTLGRGDSETPVALVNGVKSNFVVGEIVNVSFRMTDYKNGDTCVTFWYDGAIKFNYWDKKTVENTPVQCNPETGTHEELMTYGNIWTGWMPFTVIDPDKQAVDSFVATYIADAAAEDYTKTAEEDREATCRSKYNTAMAAFNDDEVLTATQRNLFNTGVTYADARAALEYWDTHSAKSTPVRTLGGLSDGNKTTALIVAASIGILVTAFGCAFLLKKRKEN